jgi:hypothetical protein
MAMRSRLTVRLLFAFSFLALLLTRASSVRADDEAAIESAVQEGIALRRAGNDEGALTLFLELERKNPRSARVLLHVAAAAQATGRWLLTYEYLRKGAAFNNDPYYVRNRAAVKAVEDAVARHVGQLRVVGRPAGAEVRLSGNLIGTLPFNEPVAVELGSYVLEVSKPGYYSLRRDIVLSPSATLSQELVELGASDQPGPAAPAPRALAVAPPPAHPAPDRVSSWWESRAVTWSLAGIALAGTGTAGVALAIREQKIERWNDDARCLDHDDVTRRRQDVCGDDRDAATAAGAVAITGGAVAALFATAALTHWLTTSGKDEKQAQRAPPASCGVGFGGVVCNGTF